MSQMKIVKKIAGVCLCHRAMYGVAAYAYGAGAVHLVGEAVVLAVVGAVYLLLAVRG
jgi:hypothetical protein